MHILRSTYVPAYDSLVRPPYTSDPFSRTASHHPASSKESIFATHRELATLDSFIALLAHEDLMLDSTALHLPREEAYKDLFDLMQPRSRLEDLVREIGVADGVIFDGDPSECPLRVTSATNPSRNLPPNPTAPSLNEPPSPSPSPSRSSFNLFSKSSIKASLSRVKRSPPNSTPPSPLPPPAQVAHVPVQITPVPFAYLSVSFTPRRVGLVYTLPSKSSGTTFHGSEFGALSLSVSGPTGPGGRKKTIVDVVRDRREEPLEVCARNLVKALRAYLEEDAMYS
ncbi:hypothetical protein BDZ89DRAFT_1061596 [Hymenopellis radicata]|nr:hypothetical protein BDZ89DRAFT_1061596 [Hymenopellis radicata]